MKTVTLGQLVKIILLFRDAPSEQMRLILESGLLADIRDGNIAGVKRNDFRKLLGRMPPLLVTIRAASHRSFVNDMAKSKWWTLESDIAERDMAEGVFELCEFFEIGENLLNGFRVRITEIARRAESLNANLGQRHAESLLETQHQIPAGLRNYCISFPGTVWRDTHDLRRIPFICWGNGGWDMGFRCPEHGFFANDRLLGLHT